MSAAPIPPSRAPTHTCFIGNLPYDITETQLKDLFAEVGPIKKFRIVTDKDTGRQKGFAFCEYFDIPTAESAQRNLNAHDLNGRRIRVDFAEDKGHDRDPSAPRPPRRNEPVGVGTAASAAQAVSGLVGGAAPAGPGGAPDPITSTLAGMSRKQLYDILSQMKGLINQNPAQARQIMVQNPQLTKALFQAQVLLGMVPVPGTGGPLQPPPAQGQQQQQQQQQPSPQYQQAPPVQQQQQPSPQYQQPAAQYGQPQYLQPAPAASGAPPAMYAAPGGYVPPPVQHHAGPAADPYAAQQVPQPAQQHQYGAPQPQQPAGYQQAPPVQHQVDPRYQGAPAAADPRQQQQPQPAPNAQSALDQHKALLEKVMSLTPAQIDLLPPEQKAQVIALQTQMGSAVKGCKLA